MWRGGVLRGSSLRARSAVVARLEERRDRGDARRGRRRSRLDRREVVRLGERDGVERASPRRTDGASVLRLGLGRRPGVLHRSTRDDAARGVLLRRHRRRGDESDLHHHEGARERRGACRRRRCACAPRRLERPLFKRGRVVVVAARAATTSLGKCTAVSRLVAFTRRKQSCLFFFNATFAASSRQTPPSSRGASSELHARPFGFEPTSLASPVCSLTRRASQSPISDGCPPSASRVVAACASPRKRPPPRRRAQRPRVPSPVRRRAPPPPSCAPPRR